MVSVNSGIGLSLASTISKRIYIHPC